MNATTTPKHKRNWKKYNSSLTKRGRIDIWVGENREAWWYGNGRQVYSDQSIELILTLKFVYHLPLKAVIGLMTSLFEMNDIEVSIPDYTTVSRRARNLTIPLRKQNKKSITLLVDSTGLKVHGEGEWKVRKHGWNYRRTWKKLHVGIDIDGEVRAIIMSSSKAHDAFYGEQLLLQEKTHVHTFSGDGAYDSMSLYMLLEARSVQRVFIPPRKNTNRTKEHHPLKQQNLLLSRETWKKESGYHIRSLVETHMWRHKQILSPYLDFRTEASQRTEILIKTNILNKMLFL